MTDTASHILQRRSVVLGIGMITLASVFWSLSGALIKLVTDEGRGPGGVTIAFYRSLVAGVVLFPLAWNRWRVRDAAGETRSVLTRPAALSCVLFFTLMTISFVIANTITQAANVIILQYTSTFWIFGLSPLILQEKPRSSDLWILALALMGIVIIFFGESAWGAIVRGTETSGSPVAIGSSADKYKGMAIALASGLFYALLTLMIRRLRDADSAAVTVMNLLGSALLLLPLVLAGSGLFLSKRSLLLLILMGVVQFGLPYYLYTLGLKRIPAYQAALITLLEPVLVPVWAVLAIGASEMPPVWTLIGGGVIFAALLLFVRAARRSPVTASSP